MRIDPWKHKEKYLAWKEKYKNALFGISKENSDIIMQYLNDMERGVNIANGSAKGSRSHSRLTSLRNRLIFFSKKFKKLYNLDNICNITEEQLVGFFLDMRNGTLRKAYKMYYPDGRRRMVAQDETSR